MLELRPTCEHCNKALPPDSLEARICFLWVHLLRLLCRTRPGKCLHKLRWWVPPSTGSAFDELERGQLGKDSVSTKVTYRQVDPAAHARFSAKIKAIPPEKR